MPSFSFENKCMFCAEGWNPRNLPEMRMSKQIVVIHDFRAFELHISEKHSFPKNISKHTLNHLYGEMCALQIMDHESKESQVALRRLNIIIRYLIFYGMNCHKDDAPFEYPFTPAVDRHYFKKDQNPATIYDELFHESVVLGMRGQRL